VEGEKSLEKQKVDIRLILVGKVKEHFIEIKEDMGLKNDTEVLRHIISEYYRIHQAELGAQA
jgi:hypothetical protein